MISMERIRSYLPISLLIFSILLSACGGGSEGTGVSARSLEGKVISTEAQPLANVGVTLLETGDTDITDANGRFTLPLPETESAVNLEVATPEFTQRVSLAPADPDAISVSVALTVDQKNQSVSAKYINVWARIVGACDFYFENRMVIRQSNAVKGPLSCILRFFASGDGQKLARIHGEIEVRSCNSHTWRPIADGSTGFGVNAGVGEIPFTFIDNERNCEYRLAAPRGYAGQQELYVYISTFTLQGKKSAK